MNEVILEQQKGSAFVGTRVYQLSLSQTLTCCLVSSRIIRLCLCMCASSVFHYMSRKMAMSFVQQLTYVVIMRGRPGKPLNSAAGLPDRVQIPVLPSATSRLLYELLGGVR
jgi:hypothetical protein